MPEERIFLLKPKAALDELPAESTDVESDNIIQRYSKRPKQLSKFCLADYVSKVDIIYPKGNKFPEKVNDKNDDDSCDSSSSNESEDSIDDDNSKISDLRVRGWSCEPNNQLNVCTTSVTEGKVAGVKLV